MRGPGVSIWRKQERIPRIALKNESGPEKRMGIAAADQGPLCFPQGFRYSPAGLQARVEADHEIGRRLVADRSQGGNDRASSGGQEARRERAGGSAGGKNNQLCVDIRPPDFARAEKSVFAPSGSKSEGGLPESPVYRTPVAGEMDDIPSPRLMTAESGFGGRFLPFDPASRVGEHPRNPADFPAGGREAVMVLDIRGERKNRRPEEISLRPPSLRRGAGKRIRNGISVDKER